MSLRSAFDVAMGKAVQLIRKPVSSVEPPRLEDHVIYGACRGCGWRANIQGVGMAPRCPDCNHGLTVLGGTISEVAARLDHFPDGGF